MNRLSVAFLAVAGLLSGGCSSSSGGDAGTAAPTPVALSDVPSALAQAECSLLTQCFGAAASFVLQGRDCVSYYTSVFQAGSLGDEETLVGSGKLTYDGTQVSACAAAFAAQSCTALSNALPDACLAVFTGTTETGGACTESSECANDGACVGHGMCPGACAARLAAGASCTEDDQCVRGLVCAAGASSQSTCVMPANEGQACNVGAPPCAGTLLCIGSDQASMTPGTCKAASELFVEPLGAACDLTKSDLCVEGAFCAAMITGSGASTKVTYQCVGASSQSGACGISEPDSCPSGQYCTATEAMPNGTCTDLPDDGMPCGGGTHCKPTSACDGAACRPLQANGASCATGSTCFSGRCVNQMCVADQACLSP